MGRIKNNSASSSSSSFSFRPFKDFYGDWVSGLRSTLLPVLRHSISTATAAADHPCSAEAALPVIVLDSAGAMISSDNILPTHVRAVHAHFQAYFQALDAAAAHDVAQLLVPAWRNALEQPFLWLGDFHPAIFTNLLRSFLHCPSSKSSFAASRALDGWKNPSRGLVARMEQVERSLRKVVPVLVARYRDAQTRFLEAAVDEWANGQGNAVDVPPSTTINSHEATRAMKELAGVFLEANRLRRSILAEIVGAMDMYQAAVYLEALAQFVVGFRDPDLLREFERSKIPLSPSPSSA